MKNLSTTVFVSSLLAGVGLSLYGLIHFSWPQVLPWSDPSALLRFIAFIGTTGALILTGVLWKGLNPIATGALVAVSISLLTGEVWSLLMALWFPFASIVLGNSVLSVITNSDNKKEPLCSLLAGAGIYGVIVGLLAHFKVNYAGVYGLGLSLPIMLRWQLAVEYGKLITSYARTRKTINDTTWLDVAIAAVALIYFVVALMPELGHDALAMHLFIPGHMAMRHKWGFDPDTYVWSVMPMLGDWIFSITYVLAGETATRLINVGFIFGLAWLARDLVLWANGTTRAARWAALIFLSTPLTFTEGSKLFIESVWAAFLVAGVLELLRSYDGQGQPGRIVRSAIFFGLAASTKAVTLTILPVLFLIALWNSKSLRRTTNLSTWTRAISIFLIIAAVPYVTAWWITGNPVFPFFNGIFHSKYYPSTNFDSATIFGKGVTWNILYRGTFDSGKYLEATVGAPGFQWLLLLVPAVILLGANKHRRGIALICLGLAIVAAVFQSVSYFRYAFPAWIIVAAGIGVAISSVPIGAAAKSAWISVAVATIVLNLLFLSAGAQHRDFPLKSIIDDAHRHSYLQERLPIRNAVQLINHLNTTQSPVAVFSHAMAAGLHSDALYANWYNFRFQGEINNASTVDSMANSLLQRNVDFVVLDSSWPGIAGKRDLIEKATLPIAELGSITIRKVKTDYRFQTELLKHPDFSSIEGWSLAPGAKFDAQSAVITTTVADPATQAVQISPGQRFRNAIIARCKEDKTVGRIQVNWLDSQGQFITTDIRTFDCTQEWSEHSMDVASPPAAAVAIVYAASHTTTPIQFKKNSLKQ